MLSFLALCALAGAPEDIQLSTGATMQAFAPSTPAGCAVIVCPGGGYATLADYEGRDYALFLNRYGVTAFVLNYRLGSKGFHYPAPLDDLREAIRIVRSRHFQNVGVMGSSAGGHLAGLALTSRHWHLDFGILCYPVISMEEHANVGSRDNLIGRTGVSPASLSLQKRVTKETPPCFVWTTTDDNVVDVENSRMFVEAMKAHRIPCEYHEYPHGRHGLGLGGKPDGNHLLPWTGALIDWLHRGGWLQQS